MIIFPDYVASFTSRYTYQSACKKMNENKSEYEKGLSLIEKVPEGDSVRFRFNSKKAFLPEMEVILKEKTEGALVYARINAKAFTKVCAVLIVLLLISAFASLVTLACIGTLSALFPVLFVPFSVVFCMGVERLWAKRCCIKTYRYVCNTLDHKPDKVMIIKVLNK